MPAIESWRREVFPAFAILCAVIVAATALLNLADRDDAFEVSLWLGANAFFVLVALAAVLRNRSRAGFWFALLSTVISLLGVGAYLLAFNGLFPVVSETGFTLVRTSDVHMSGSLALLFASVALVAAATTQRHGFGRDALATAGAVILLLVCVVFVGQWFHVIPLEAGILAQPLLPGEGIILLVLAGLLFLAAGALPNAHLDLHNRFLPLLAFAVLVAASFHLWLVLVGQEQQAIRRQTVTTAERLAGSATDHFQERILALQRMAGRLVAAADPQHDTWLQDARNYLEDFTSISAIGWVTPDGIVKWAISRDDERYHVGEQYATEPRRRDALAKARDAGEVAFSSPLPLRAGGFGHIVVVPLSDAENFRGWLVVGVRFDELFVADVANVAPGFGVRIVENGELIYSRSDEAWRRAFVPVARTRVEVDDLDWELELWPERDFFENLFLWLPAFMLTLGLLASLMFAFALYQLEALRRGTEKLRESEARYRLTALQTGEIVYDYHVPTGRIEWAGAIEEITGESPEAFAGVDIDGWIARLHPDDAMYVLPRLARAERSVDRFTAEYRFLRANGHYVRVEERGVFIAGSDGRAERMLGTMADVTERYEFEQQLRYLAHFDQPTGLRNRVWFMEDAVRRAELRARKDTFWCVFLDVDRFRAVNETLGHAVGDVLLEGIARRLESIMGSHGELARLGGDEFGICIVDADRETVIDLCEQLMEAFKRPISASGHSLFVTLSVGVAAFPDDGDDVQAVIRAAETAMFRAKQRGRNTYAFYEAPMSAGARENLEIANALRRALEQEELHLVFQPRYSLSTGRITGMEALLRWESAELGSVSPGVFIPVAEETGLIGPIGWYVVDAAAAAARRIGPDGMLGRRMAINVSARQLIHTDFVPQLVRRIEAAGARPHWFEIELTESLMMEDPQRARELFIKLHDHGFTVAIDDFGTGYSSLSYLTHFPADCLKVDRSFVMGLPQNEEMAAIVRTIVSLGQGLGMKLVAEGIETEAQSEFLKQAGCQEAQGFLFARPMSLAQLSVLLD